MDKDEKETIESLIKEIYNELNNKIKEKEKNKGSIPVYKNYYIKRDTEDNQKGD